MRLSQSSGLAIPLLYHAKALSFTFLYGPRFFTSPFRFFHVCRRRFVPSVSVDCELLTFLIGAGYNYQIRFSEEKQAFFDPLFREREESGGFRSDKI